MTCAHVVNVALKKVSGVESVEVSLNKGLATVKLKPDNAVSIPQLWEIIRKNGYTPKSTNVLVRGEVVNSGGSVQLKVSGTKDTLPLAASADVARKLGQTVVIRGVIEPSKDPKASAPLIVQEMK
jgi:copper chaperone CopZ